MTIAFPVPGQMYIYVDPIDNTWAGPTDGTFHGGAKSDVASGNDDRLSDCRASKNDVRDKTWRQDSLPRHP